MGRGGCEESPGDEPGLEIIIHRTMTPMPATSGIKM